MFPMKSRKKFSITIPNDEKEDGIAVTNCIKVSDEIMETIMEKGAGEAMNRYNNFGKTEA